MTLKNTLKTSLTGLRTHRLRSFLTIFGITIGITSIMLVISLGGGASAFILGQIQSMGSKTIVVAPGRHPEGPNDFAGLFLDSLKERDLKAILNKSNAPYVADAMPIVFGTARFGYRNDTYQATILGGGSSENNNVMAEIFDIYPAQGEFFSADDVRSRASVVVIGEKIRKELFEDVANPLGEKLKINGKSFRIVAVLPEKGQVSFFNFDDMALLPYTTAGQYLLGRKYFDRIIVSADSEEHITATVEDLKRIVRENHNITDTKKDDFFVETQVDLAERIKTVTTALTVFLVAVAGIALFVGGVGIMNIMLVSVTERTREIGLRKALGAKSRDILTQFLFEAVILTGIGGALGILIGASLSFIISLGIARFALPSWSFSFPYLGALLGLLVSLGIGLIFGIYPARTASRKSPMEALRYE